MCLCVEGGGGVQVHVRVCERVYMCVYARTVCVQVRASCAGAPAPVCVGPGVCVCAGLSFELAFKLCFCTFS